VAPRDPLANPSELIRRVYGYVAYRIGDGPDAEDVTNDVFERAVRYRDSYDSARGAPLHWLLGIARRCVDTELGRPRPEEASPPDLASREDLEEDTVQRLSVAAALEGLDDRSKDLVALRYGADLTAKQIGEILGLKTNAVEVALHRTLARLRPELEGEGARAAAPTSTSPPAPGSEKSEQTSGWA
jgi:RNA polymerase sigma factor (sigma-70 family)